uniref:Uncharacterized protein n=1 Tax=Anguilla anguilla TaxID=7936 RepID=A0A0E9W8G4_ANGAN
MIITSLVCCSMDVDVSFYFYLFDSFLSTTAFPALISCVSVLTHN